MGYNQSLSGFIPSSIGNLIQLEHLGLYNDQLNGSIPDSLSNLVKLTYLELSINKLSGPIPSFITGLSELTNLGLSNNQLSGSIPSSIGNLAKLTNLGLHDNQLSGSIPSSIGNLVKLAALDLKNNKLSGSIPSSLGNLTELTYLGLYNNQLSGSIPSSIGKLVKLIQLYFDHNQLTGNIPATFMHLTANNVGLSYNRLTQTKNLNPSWFSGNQYIYLDISYNDFTFNGEYIIIKYPQANYTPQAPVIIHRYGNKLSVYAGGTLSENSYKWFRSGSTDNTVITGDSTFQPTQNGKYYAEVTNSVATRLTLTTDTINYIMPLAQNEKVTAEIKSLNNHFTVYPTLAHNIIYISVNKMAEVVVTNTSGKIMLMKNINNSGTIDVNDLTAGVYYIQNKTSGEVQKIVVVH